MIEPKTYFADLVLRVNETGDDVKRTQLCKYANRILGDITLGATWAPFAGATENKPNSSKRQNNM